MRIGLMTYADVDNYGDILFPLICRRELARRLVGAEFELFSCTGVSVEDIAFSAYDRQRIQNQHFDALLMTGGEVIHCEDAMMHWIYERLGRVSRTSQPTDIVYDWTNIADAYKAWISVGAPNTGGVRFNQKIRTSYHELDRIATRGLLSRANLETLVGERITAPVIPDIVWLLPYHVQDASADWVQLADRLRIGDPSKPYMVFHTLPGCLTTTNTAIEDLAARLSQTQGREQLRILLLPITRCWEDWKTLEALAQASGGDLQALPRDLTVKETACVLMNCKLFVGSSLHGAITCLAAGIPAGVIYPQPETKFTELFGAQYRLDRLIRRWEDLDALVSKLTREPRQPLVEYAHVAAEAVSGFFDLVASEILLKA